MKPINVIRAKAEDLLNAHRFVDAFEALKPHADHVDADFITLSLYGQALAGLGRDSEALSVFERAAKRDPVAGRGDYNCAILLERMARYEASAALASKAIKAGYDTEDSQVLFARASQGAGDFDVAETAYLASLSLNPLRGDVQRDFAQLVWMRTADVQQATRALVTALNNNPNHPDLVTQLAKALDHGGDPDTAYRLLMEALATSPEASTPLHIAAFTIARDQGNSSAALYHALHAAKASPENPAALLAVCDAKMAIGEVAKVLDILEELHFRLPLAQQITARLATAYRLLDRSEYDDLMNYEAFVKSYDLTEICGWETPEGFLMDLCRALRSNHRLETHPFDQSVRNGTQTLTNIYLSPNCAIRAFFAFAEKKMKSYMDGLSLGSDNFTKRNTGQVKVIDAWSVKQLKGGSHQNHVHQNGWLSTVFYADLPSDIDDKRKSGWLKFGEPGIQTDPLLQPDHYISPKLGRLVIFPSYAWHGTLPFSGTGERLTIAFDVVPVE